MERKLIDQIIFAITSKFTHYHWLNTNVKGLSKKKKKLKFIIMINMVIYVVAVAMNHIFGHLKQGEKTTLSELLSTYQFHDCDVITPFYITESTITITFALAKHLQFENIKTKYYDKICDKSQSFIVKTCFSLSSAIFTTEHDGYSKINKSYINEKQLSFEQFDNEWDFISIFIDDKQGEVELTFSINSKKSCRINFISNDVEIIDETFVDEEGLDKLYDMSV